MQIILGTANFNKVYGLRKKKVKKKNIIGLLKYSLKNKINRIDTAITYGNTIHNTRQKFLIDTKVSLQNNFFIQNNSLENFIKKLKSDLNNLKIFKFNTVYIHNIYKFHDKKILMKISEFLKIIKTEKITTKVGISLYDTKDLKKIIDIVNPDVVQVPLNIIDRRFEKKINFLKIRKIEVIARSIFLQGILLSNNSKFKKKFSIFNKIEKWIKKNKINRLSMCINYIKSVKNLSGFIIGVDNITHLEEIIKESKNKNLIYPKKLMSNNTKLIDPRKW